MKPLFCKRQSIQEKEKERMNCPKCNKQLVNVDCDDCDGGYTDDDEPCETCGASGVLDDVYECLECGDIYEEGEL